MEMSPMTWETVSNGDISNGVRLGRLSLMETSPLDAVSIRDSSRKGRLSLMETVSNGDGV